MKSVKQVVVGLVCGLVALGSMADEIKTTTISKDGFAEENTMKISNNSTKKIGGDVLWKKTKPLKNSHNLLIRDMKVMTNGNIVISGYWPEPGLASFDQGGNLIFELHKKEYVELKGSEPFKNRQLGSLSEF